MIAAWRPFGIADDTVGLHVVASDDAVSELFDLLGDQDIQRAEVQLETLKNETIVSIDEAQAQKEKELMEV